MALRLPKPLKIGDKVRAVAPSFGVTTEPYATRYSVSKKNWEKAGYVVEEGPCIYLAEGVASSASPEKRAREIMDAFESEASLILSVGGGETMVDILPHLDFDRIAALPPKWFMGFSDNTNLCFPLAVLANTQSIYGPCFPQFFLKKWRLSESDSLRMLQGERHFEGYPKYSITHSNPLHPLWTYRLTQEKVITPIHYQKPMEGTLLGGCLDCLLTLCGTKFDKVKEFNAAHEEGIIWFLEACDLSPLGIRRGLFQLKEAGWFDHAKGFLIGRPLCGEAEAFGVDRFSAVRDILEPLGLPILMDVDLGHVPPSMPIRVGAEARVSFESGNIIFDYK